jgi:hypothetical protein
MTDVRFQNLKTQTFGEQQRQGKRPRLSLEQLKKQLSSEELKNVWHGTIWELLQY